MPWLPGLLGAIFQRLWALFLVTSLAKHARALAFAAVLISVYSSLFIGLVIFVKTAVIAVRMSMPPILAKATFFLPPNLPVILSTVITVRLSIAVYRWTRRNLDIYAEVKDKGHYDPNPGRVVPF